MSAGPSRREVVQAGGAAAAVAPFLGAKAAGAEMDKKAIAPVITIFDHRGCDRITKEYQGRKANTYDDYMLVKVKGEVITVSTSTAASVLAETFGLLDRAARS